MLVTLPFALILLDAWPLGRWRIGDGTAGSWMPPRALWIEKLPLFLLAFASCVITWIVQRAAMPTGEAYPLHQRLGNAVIACLTYVRQTAWPAALSPFYPHPGRELSAAMVVVSATILSTLTAIVLRSRRRAPPVVIGWLWFLGTLVPVIGIVQVGS